MKINPLYVDPTDLLNEGRNKLQEERNEIEKGKVNILRVGSCGAIIEDGDFIGVNPYVTLARFMGYQLGFEEHTLNIFDAGFGNEVMWEKYLTEAGVDYKAEEDYPLLVPEDVLGHKLTGRPDLVIGETVNNKFNPTFGVELKSAQSYSGAQVFKKGIPKTENLIQAATYSMFFEIPWVLNYTMSANIAGLKAPKKSFFIGIDEFGGIYYEDSLKKRTNTLITTEGIRDYYKAISEAFTTRDHSFFCRNGSGFDGEPTNTWDEYNSFLLAVDSKLDFEEWDKRAKYATSINEQIMLSRARGRQDMYNVKNLKTGVVKEFNTLAEARDHLYRGM